MKISLKSNKAYSWDTLSVTTDNMNCHYDIDEQEREDYAEDFFDMALELETKDKGRIEGLNHLLKDFDDEEIVSVLKLRGETFAKKELKDIYDKIIKDLKAMSSEEGFQTLVNAGIYDKEGNLTKEYGG